MSAGLATLPRPAGAVPEMLARRLRSEKECRADDMLLVIAHPDDEAIALGGHLHRLAGIRIILVTDGSPVETAFRPAGLTRSDYAAQRRREFAAAMDAAGIPAENALALGFTDLRVIGQIAPLARALAVEMRRWRTRYAITHAYEGGHPDHDAIAIAVRAAAALVGKLSGQAVGVVEAPFYHLGTNGRVHGQFHDDAAAMLELGLGERGRAARARLFACYPSQAHVLAAFDPGMTRFRACSPGLPDGPPNGGRLLYAEAGFPVDRERLMHAIAESLAELGLSTQSASQEPFLAAQRAQHSLSPRAGRA